MNFLRQSTAISCSVGPFVLTTDGDTEYASTFAATDVHLFKHNGGAGSMTAKNDATAPTMETKGFARVTLNTTDTNTAGNLLVALHKSTTLVAFRWFSVLPANVYDALFAETGTGIRSIPQSTATGAFVAASFAAGSITNSAYAAGAISNTTYAAGAIDATVIAPDAIGSSELAASAATEIAAAVWDEPASSHVTAGSFGAVNHIANTGTAQTGSTGTTIKLAAGASSTSSIYNSRVIVITAGTGRGQIRLINAYVGSTKVATIDYAWKIVPDTTSQYAIL